MRLALALGERHLGLTWPNPSVGAVLVDERGGAPVIIAQGFTQAGGRPHAERMALDAAGEAARGATLYVTLEPCSSRSRTNDGASCTDLIVASGVGRLVIGAGDPSPFAHGHGYARLQDSGVHFSTGVCEAEARRLHRGHLMRVKTGRPEVIVKLARTTEGLAGRRSGPRLMITGDIANARTHLMRAHADAVMVGVGTVLADDPLLTVRLPGLEGRSPVRIILDSGLRTPMEAHVVTTARDVPTWIVAGLDAPVAAERALVAAGIEVLRVDVDADGRPVLADALGLLGSRGITRIFCEGGPALAEGLAQADLIDELVLITGRSARGEGDVPALGAALHERMDEMRLIGDEQVGSDLIMSWEKA
ncbi:bifunctional diaminohydroxyphosphoribosylaminopyrimidine deaminase/5-amino-6-(5-phosphoribosylamino)uracil reductase RibD [Microvirga antarctica]|uniref:bifunctional diaminohydroxyphosphoribosylaminopyrimidine deaminase/5-amino-6-(5-phosphoribosylamino)uracil reductase RibD n=1 Tax=Microvirga antarctica TaxID=2819233 RepID=UPI001FE398B7